MTQPLPTHDPRWRADPLADHTITRVLKALGSEARPWEGLDTLSRQIEAWQRNGDLATWQPDPQELPGDAGRAVREYLDQAARLPEWADARRIERAEALFMGQGPLSCLLLFCASLPECYVRPDLAAVLHAAGQLEQHTDFRIRMTAAMIFPAMMAGGLTDPAGGGVAQILKVRLIHASIRHLVLRGSPEAALASPERHRPRLDHAPAPGTRALHHAMWRHGWDVDRAGLPCNQEELAYTLLTFHYVFLRGMRTLRLGLPPADEAAYLHTWNVVGALLGIEPGLMPADMDRASAQFRALQARGEAPRHSEDPRPALARALMGAMTDTLPLRALRDVPTLLTRHLCGRDVAKLLGLDGRTAWASRLIFWTGLGLTRLIDGIARWLWPGFSLSRLFCRILGYHTITGLLMDQTRPLKLPDHLLLQIHTTAHHWSEDVHAPAWARALEDRLTTAGSWVPPVSAADPV